MREGVDAGRQQSLGIFEGENVRGDTELQFVRLVNHGSVERRRQLRKLAIAIVDPDLDQVDLLGGLFPHGLAGLGLRRNPVGYLGAALLWCRDAAAGQVEPGEARRGLRALGERHLGAIQAQAERRADAELRALP